MAADQQDKEFEITTTAQVERTYKVKATDSEAAHKRLRRFIEDPDMVREDLVSLIEGSTIDKTGQKVQTESIKEVPKLTQVGATGAGDAKAS